MCRALQAAPFMRAGADTYASHPSLPACSAPLMMAVGSPIHVPHIAPGQPGYREAVDAAHEQLVRALVELYEKYKVCACVCW